MKVDVLLLLNRDFFLMFSDGSQRREAREIEIDECDAVDQTDWVAVMWLCTSAKPFTARFKPAPAKVRPSVLVEISGNSAQPVAFTN